MKRKFEYELGQLGYKKLSYDLPGASVYFTNENRYVNAIILADMNDASFDREQIKHFKKNTEWRFRDGGCIEVHILMLLFNSDIHQAAEFGNEDAFCWIIDTTHQKLVIYEDKVEDFYGLKSHLEDILENRLSQKYETGIKKLEYDVKGRPFYKDIRQRPLANHAILIINLFLFSCCILSGNILYDKGLLCYIDVFENGQYYRMITSMFLHGDINHLVGNMLLLYLLGDIVERAVGHIKYFVLYILGGFIAGLFSMGFAYLSGSINGSIGASGAVFAVVGALLWIALLNHGKIETLTTKKILVLIGISLYSGFASTNVDNAAHVGGLIGGILLGIILYRHKRITE